MELTPRRSSAVCISAGDREDTQTIRIPCERGNNHRAIDAAESVT